MVEVEGKLVSVPGTARMFVLPANNAKAQNLRLVRKWLSANNDDDKWLRDSTEGVKVMVLVHRMAAQNMGFPDVYAALNDHGSGSLKDGLLDGSAWVLRPFMQFILPLVRAAKAGEDFAVVKLLRDTAPALQKDNLKSDTARKALDQLNIDLADLVALLDSPHATTRDVLTLVHQRNLYPIDQRLRSRIEELPLGVPEGQDDDAAIAAFLACAAKQMWNYENYVLRQSPFDTHQGVKGAEFDRVLVVLDDEEANYSLFSYGKLLGVTPLSAKDQENIDEGKESVLDRTTRLFCVLFTSGWRSGGCFVRGRRRCR